MSYIYSNLVLIFLRQDIWNILFHLQNIENQINVKTVKKVIIPFIKQVLDKYNEMNNNQIELINQHEKEISDLGDVKPATIQIKRDIKRQR